jgi:hypothetical protein
MMPDEKERLLALLEDQAKWCRDAEARDADGHAVRFEDETAVAWDITGALCWLFGWKRACVLFGQLDRHINGRRVAVGWPAGDAEMRAMGALQDFNDRLDMTFDMMREQIETMPVWHGNTCAIGAASRNASVTAMQTRTD